MEEGEPGRRRGGEGREEGIAAANAHGSFAPMQLELIDSLLYRRTKFIYLLQQRKTRACKAVRGQLRRSHAVRWTRCLDGWIGRRVRVLPA